MQLVEQHSRNRPPIVQFADRIAGRFVRIVLAVAAMTFMYWVWFSRRRKAIDNAVALLIVTCPCALGLATPLAVTIALGRAARRHILVKGGEVFEALSRQGVMLLDKTGHAHRGADLAGLLERRRGPAAVGRGAGTAFGPSHRPGPG